LKKTLLSVSIPECAKSDGPDFGKGILSRNMRRFRLWHGLIGVALVAGVVAVSVPASRTWLLRSAGYFLVGNKIPPKSADIIVVAIDAGGAGTLEASDLVHSGVANRVAVFNDPPTVVDREFLRRGLPYDDRGAISIAQLRELGVENVEKIPRTTSGSEQEGQILPGWCAGHGYHSFILVTSADHSRRLTRILHRAFHNQPVHVTVLGSHYSVFNPDDWWRSREGARTEVMESEKLLLDIVRHPLS